MNRKLLTLLLALPGLSAVADVDYHVTDFAKTVKELVVDNENTADHDFSIRLDKDLSWYATAKDTNIGISHEGSTKFRLVKTAVNDQYKLYCVKNGKFVSFTDANNGPDKARFTDNKDAVNTNWWVLPNMGKGGNSGKFDILPAPSASSAHGANAPAWNVHGGVNNGKGLIGSYNANDDGSCWRFEIEGQTIKFFSTYDAAAHDSYFMTIRGRYVHSNGTNFDADYNLAFENRDKYLFQLVGTPQNFQIYNVSTGLPIGTKPNAGQNQKDMEDDNRYINDETKALSHFSVQSFGGRVYVKENRGNNIYLNFREPYLSTWHNAAAWNRKDEGSQILFSTEDGILATAAAELEKKVKATCPDNKFGDALGQFPAAGKSKRDEVLQGLMQAQNLSDNATATKKENYKKAGDFLNGLALNMPQDGDLLFLSAVRDQNEAYFTSTPHNDGDKGYQNADISKHLTTRRTQTPDAVFRYKTVGDKATLTSVATGRQLLVAKTGNRTYPTLAEGAAEGTPFSVTTREGNYCFATADGFFLSADANMNYATADAGYNATFAGIRLKRVAETLPVHIGAAGFSGFWSPVEYTVPEGVTAYAVKLEGGHVILHSVAGNVPAATAVFLKGTPSADVVLTVVPAGTTPALTDNILRGGAETHPLSGQTVYMLKRDQKSLIKVSDVVPAFKAYFSATESQARELFDAVISALSGVSTRGESPVLYDLSGRRVRQTTRGTLYINPKGGHKFIAK